MGGKLVKKCVGCDHASGDFCKIWVSPEARFRIGRGISCGTATHIKIEGKNSEEKIRAGQQKQKKKK
jgi:hypothetical protein